MIITIRDIGRKVRLRNGDICTITKITYQDLYPVTLDSMCTYTTDGLSCLEGKCDYDIINFLDEEEDTQEETPKKYDDNKPRVDLIIPEFTLAIGEALGYGANKYNETRGDTPNYLKGDGFEYSKIYASAQRHLNEWYSGVDIDEESGLNHLQLAATNLMFLYTYSISDKGIDDRIKLNKKVNNEQN